MVNSSTHPEVVLIKQDDKFFSRLLTKEKSSKGESSLRFYYYEGSSGSIPFCWESRPGTPKPSFNGGSVPPLTPPPSYQSSSAAAADERVKSTQKSSRKPRFSFPSFFRSSKKTGGDDFPPNSLWSPSASPSCSSSFSSSSAVALTDRRRHRRSRSDVRFDEYGDPVAGVSPSSTLCSKRFHVGKMKRAFLSIVGHGY